MSATFNETLNILLETGMSYEDAYRQAESITATRERTGELSPAEMDILMVLMEGGITGKRAEDMARTINAQRVAAGTTREEEIASRPMPPEPTPEPTTVTTQGPPAPLPPLPPESEAPIRNELPYDLGPADRPMDTPGNREPQTVRKPGEEPLSDTTRRPTVLASDAPRTGGSIYSTLTEPGRFSRKFVVPADEDPEEFADIFEQLFKLQGSSSGAFENQLSTRLDGWAARLDSPEMRGLFAPTETFIALDRRSSTEKSNEYNDLVDEAINAASARRQRVGANIFIYDLLDSLPAEGEDFVADSRFNAGSMNHAEHIYNVNQFVFGKQIDMAGLFAGRPIQVGDIQLADGYVIPNVTLSSAEEYVDLINNQLGEQFDDPGTIERLTTFFGLNPQTGFAGEFDRLIGFNEETGLDYNEDQARELFDIPLDWLLLYDSRIESAEAAREESQVLKTTITQLGSTTGEDVGGGLIRSGYQDELESLDPTLFGADRTLIQNAQAQIGVVQPPGFGTIDPDDFPAIPEGGFDPDELQEIGDSFLDLGDYDGPVDRAEYDLLTTYLEQNYGGFSFFFDLDADKLKIGLNQFDKPVERDSDEAVRNVHILDYITGRYTTHDTSGPAGQVLDDQLLFEALRATEWYRTTNVSMREWEGEFGADPLRTFQFDLTQFEREDRVGVNVEDSIYEDLVQAAREIMGAGAEDTIGKNRLIMLAAEIDYLGYDTDSVEQRKRLLDSVIRSEVPWQASTADFSAFRLTRDSVESLAARYYIPITDKRRDEYAEMLFTGEMTEEGVIAQLRSQAMARYGTSDQVTAALQAGMTMEDYFDPYTARMELILDRPVDLMLEFPEVIEMVSADGNARPMTHAELGEYVRGLPEWGQSDQGQDTARDVVTEIGKLFGETA